jgi:hypothetical protein
MLGMFAAVGFSVVLTWSPAMETVASEKREEARIVGRITSSSGLLFFPGVKITLRRYLRGDLFEDLSRREELSLREELSEKCVYETESDDNGRFEISGINPRHRYALIAEFPGFSLGVIRGIYLNDGEEQVLDLDLRVGLSPITYNSVEGRVLDEVGDPVEDATVILSSPLSPDPRLVHRTRTDGEGRFKLTVLDRPVWVLFAIKPGEELLSGAMTIGYRDPYEGLELRLSRGVPRKPPGDPSARAEQ